MEAQSRFIIGGDDVRKDIDLVENLVAVHFSNGLGNFIQMTSAIQALAKLYDAKVDLILDKKWTDSRRASVIEFCEHWDLINEVREFQEGFDKSKYKQLYHARHGENCETATYFQKNASYEASHINWRAEKVNEVDYYMSEVYDLGYRGKTPPLYCIKPRDVGSWILKSGEFSDQWNSFDVGFCNGFFAGSKWKWERKGWPYFPELSKLLKHYYPRTRLHLLGKGKVEEEWAQSVDNGKGRIYNKVGEHSLSDTICRLSKLDLLITTDTGLMHIADALNVPMVVLFGPTLVSKNGPYNKENRVARSPLQCAPCQQNHMFLSCKDWRCMRELKPWMIMSVVREYVMDLMKRKKSKIMMTDKAAVKEFVDIRETISEMDIREKDLEKEPNDKRKATLRGLFLNDRSLVKVKTGMLY